MNQIFEEKKRELTHLAAVAERGVTVLAVVFSFVEETTV